VLLWLERKAYRAILAILLVLNSLVDTPITALAEKEKAHHDVRREGRSFLRPSHSLASANCLRGELSEPPAVSALPPPPLSAAAAASQHLRDEKRGPECATHLSDYVGDPGTHHDSIHVGLLHYSELRILAQQQLVQRHQSCHGAAPERILSTDVLRVLKRWWQLLQL